MLANLSLIHALNTHDAVHVEVTSKESKEATQREAVDYWMGNKKGQGWIILDIDVHTFAHLFWEETLTRHKTQSLGPVKPNSRPLNGMMSPSILCMVEVDKYTPPFILDVARATMLGGSRLLILERKGY